MDRQTYLDVLLLGIFVVGITAQINPCLNTRANTLNPFSYYEKHQGKEVLKQCPTGQVFNATICKCNAIQIMRYFGTGGIGAVAGAGSMGGGAMSGVGSMAGAGSMGGGAMSGAGSMGGVGSMGGGTNVKTHTKHSMTWGSSSNNGIGGSLTNNAIGGSGHLGAGGRQSSTSGSSRKFKITLPFNPLLLKWNKTGTGTWNGLRRFGSSSSSSGSMGSTGSQSQSWGSGTSQNQWGSSMPWTSDLHFMGGNMRPHGNKMPVPSGSLTNIKVSGTGGSNSQSVFQNMFGLGGMMYPFPATLPSSLPAFPAGGAATNYQYRREIVRYENGKPIYRYLIKTDKFGRPIPFGPGSVSNSPGVAFPLPGSGMPLHPGMFMSMGPSSTKGTSVFGSGTSGGLTGGSVTGGSATSSGSTGQSSLTKNIHGANNVGQGLLTGAASSGTYYAGHGSLTGAAGQGSLTGAAGQGSLTGAAGQGSLTGAAGQGLLTGAAGQGSLTGAAGQGSLTGAAGQGSLTGAASAAAFFNQGNGNTAAGSGLGQWKWISDTTGSGRGKYVWILSNSAHPANGQGYYNWVPDASNPQGGSYKWLSGSSVSTGAGSNVGQSMGIVGTPANFWTANAAAGQAKGTAGLWNGYTSNTGGFNPWWLFSGESSESWDNDSDELFS